MRIAGHYRSNVMAGFVRGCGKWLMMWLQGVKYIRFRQGKGRAFISKKKRMEGNRKLAL